MISLRQLVMAFLWTALPMYLQFKTLHLMPVSRVSPTWSLSSKFLLYSKIYIMMQVMVKISRKQHCNYSLHPLVRTVNSCVNSVSAHQDRLSINYVPVERLRSGIFEGSHSGSFSHRPALIGEFRKLILFNLRARFSANNYLGERNLLWEPDMDLGVWSPDKKMPKTEPDEIPWDSSSQLGNLNRYHLLSLRLRLPRLARSQYVERSPHLVSKDAMLEEVNMPLPETCKIWGNS